jgi:hypothetical protein
MGEKIYLTISMFEDVEAELKSYKIAKKREDRYKLEIERICAQILGAQSLKERIIQKTSQEYTIERVIDDLDDFYKLYHSALNESYNIVKKVKWKLDKLKPPYNEILEKFYIDNNELWIIAKDLNYSYAQIKRKKMLALYLYKNLRG